MRIGIEKSPGTIYGRLSSQIARAVEDYGHECVWIDAELISPSNPLLRTLEKLDWALVSFPTSVMNHPLHDGRLFFEYSPTKLAFLHHDAVASEKFAIVDIVVQFTAWARMASRSVHFAIEDRDARLLKQFGIECHVLSHMPSVPSFTGKSGDVAQIPAANFVGHVLPPVTGPIDIGVQDEAAFDLYQARLRSLEAPLEGLITGLHPMQPNASLQDAVTALSKRVQMMNLVRLYTVHLRGALFSELGRLPLDIFGGDPNDEHQPPRMLLRDGIRYHDAVFDADGVAKIYRDYAVSLNLTALQFDQAVINRVLDVFAAGGFCLTDLRSALPSLTSVWQEISYRNAEELQEKAFFYIDPANRGRRREVMAQARQDFDLTCSAHAVVGKLLSVLAAHS